MTAEEIRRERDAIVARHGPWTAHNVRLAEGVWTISEQPAGDEVKLRRVVQVVLDVLGGCVEGVRILDLACLEGMYSLELASRGAEVVAIEGREANLAKARFAARALGLSVDFRLGDVRALSRDEHGEFDLVLCLGILYHLDVPDVFSFVDRLADVCGRALVIDTAVALRGRQTAQHLRYEYHGERLIEHAADVTDDERLAAVWSSLDNTNAFVFTRPSLLTLLARAGFTSVYECHVPAEPGKEPHRSTYLAFKGAPAESLLAPAVTADAETVPEGRPLGVRLPATRAWLLIRYIVPRPLRPTLRRLLGAETRRH